MAIPNITDLTLWSDHPTNPLNDVDWSHNFTQVVAWLSAGTADLVVRSVSASALQNLPQYADASVAGIVGMVAGSMIFNTDTLRPMIYDGANWTTL